MHEALPQRDATNLKRGNSSATKEEDGRGSPYRRERCDRLRQFCQLILSRGDGGGPDLDALRYDAGFDIAPQGDQQLPSHGDDGDPPRATLQCADTLAEPAGQRASRLVAQPQPGELDQRCAGSRVARAADISVPVQAATLVGHRAMPT